MVIKILQQIRVKICCSKVAAAGFREREEDNF
jgi:hypothetical protein